MSELKRPIDIEEFQLVVKDLSDKELSIIEKQINNSISKLNTSNELMNDELTELKQKLKNRSDSDIFQESGETVEIEKDISLYTESIRENGIVLNNQYNRLKAIQQELGYRMLPSAVNGKDVSQTKSKNLSSQDNDGINDGIYL